MAGKKIVALGGGVGTANLLRGLKEFFSDLTAVVSMADDGGSAGRLRRLFNMPPPGDIINCMIALSDADSTMLQLLKYRFAGNRYGADSSIKGQKLGNLLFAALTDISGDFPHALLEMQRIFKTNGKIYPSTSEDISIWAETSTGEVVNREQNIDLGKFKGRIERLHITPQTPSVPGEVLAALEAADCIICGPGDLYTTLLPVIVIPKILEALRAAKAKKFFIVNVANKSNETPGYTIHHFKQAIENHCGDVLFDIFLVNNNTAPRIEKKWQKQYSFVPVPEVLDKSILVKDLIDEYFPLYHDPVKLAKVIQDSI